MNNLIFAQDTMSFFSIHTFSYIVAVLGFIFAINQMNRPDTAKRGNQAGMAGMLVAVIGVIFTINMSSSVLILALLAIGIGGISGWYASNKVEMTRMPQMVGILNGFGGLASFVVALVAFSDFGTPLYPTYLLITIVLGVIIGAVTFTGSLVAAGKLEGIIKSTPILLPYRNWLNLGALILLAILGTIVVTSGPNMLGGFAFFFLAVIALLLGIHLIIAIGGGDMPVVIAVLNSYSGFAGTVSGFVLNDQLLIVAGTIVGASGLFLSQLMCKAMNRSLANVMLGGFGAEASDSGDGEDGDENRTHTEVSASEVAELLSDADSVIITPGYGMAVAQAQYPVAALTQKLRDKGVKVRFAIHPVAGRLPGHMNVLLAEAKVPYDIVEDMEDINDEFDETDVVLVIGANDTVNPNADKPGTPISGMPVLRVWEAERVIVFKRSLSPGYSGVQNPVFFNDNTDMLLGDAKQSVENIISEL